MKLHTRICAAIFLFSLATAKCPADDGTFDLVQAGEPRAFVLLGNEASEQDAFAAAELRKYVREMTGTELAIRRMDEGQQEASLNPILIGTTLSHGAIRRLSSNPSSRLSVETLTDEGFVIRTTRWGSRPALVIAGIGPVSPVYGVYDFLERFGRVGFFRYEEHVPRREDFVVPHTEVVERPFFSSRIFGGQAVYFGVHSFSEQDWREEIRWYAKSRYNRLEYFPGPVIYPDEQLQWKRLGIESPPWEAPSDHVQMRQRLIKFGRMLGVFTPYLTGDGQIPQQFSEEFRQLYPDAKYFAYKRGAKEEYYVHPSDPLWQRINQERLKAQIELYGPTRIFNLAAPYAERAPGTPREREALTLAFAEALGQLGRWAEQQYPGCEWTLRTWAFNNHEYWQFDRVERLINAIPKQMNLSIWHFPSEDEPGLRFVNYWYGRPWSFIVFHSMGGNTTVHGDVHRLFGHVFRTLADQRATALNGFGHITEARDYFPMYTDLVRKLAWDPTISLDRYVRDYCERRYAPESVTAMVACHEKMLKTVYGPQSDTHMRDGFRTVRLQDPVYWFELGSYIVPFDELQRRVATLRENWAPTLRDALEDALRVAGTEDGNRCFQRDLVDLMRSYAQVRLNTSIWHAGEAVRRGDAEAFERQEHHIARLFDHLLAAIAVVADRWEFGVNAAIEKAKDSAHSATPERVRHHLHFVNLGDWGASTISNYYRSDRYELIRDVYRPMTMRYLRACREQLESGDRALPESSEDAHRYHSIVDVVPEESRQAMGADYTEILKNFVTLPCAPPPEKPDAAETAQRFLLAIDNGEI